MKARKIVLFGGSGFLGSRLIANFPNYTVIAPTHTDLDLLETDKVFKFLEKNKPDVILYSAGITRIDAAEKDKELSLLLNHQVPKKIAKFVPKSKVPFIYLSTDAVFDGYKIKYQFTEND